MDSRIADSRIAAPKPGQLFSTTPRAMTRERMRWYVDAQATVVAGDGKPRFGGPTIHDDDDYARKQGLDGIIADGMVSTNWILALLVDVFGADFVRRGRLRTKYVAPVPEDMVLVCQAEVRDVTAGRDATVVELDVWAATPDGRKVTVGEARAHLPGAA